jgi:hypothetical protein
MKYTNYRYSKALTKLLQLHGNHDTASNVVEETDSERVNISCVEDL